MNDQNSTVLGAGLHDKNTRTLSMMVFIDALGWEVLKNRKFLESELPYRRKLRSVFGFSSACVPSILTGRTPSEHGHWSYFYYSPETSPFKALRFLQVLPKSLSDRGRVRHLLSRLLAKVYRFTGYFQIYNMPLNFAGLFDYCEKKDIFKPGGMNVGENIFDVLTQNDVPYHVSNWRNCEQDNLDACRNDIEKEEIRFAFLYMASMDGLLHRVGKNNDEVDRKMAWYETEMKQTLELARQHYDEVRLYICSDHGMATVDTNIDLMEVIEKLPVEFGNDYVAVYDSTMARFWFHSERARKLISEALSDQQHGRIVPDDELAALGCDFENQAFGELIFLVDPGVIIVPSHMGLKTITGMHGYHPDHPDSDAALLSNVAPTVKVEAITDLFELMKIEAGVTAAA